MNSPCHPASQPLMLPSTCGMQPKLLHTYHTHKGLDYWSTPDHSPNSYQTLPPTAINTATHGLGGLFSKPLCPPTPGSDSCPQPELGPGHLVFALFLAWLFSSDAYPDLCYVRCGPTSSYGTLLNFLSSSPSKVFKVSRVQLEHTGPDPQNTPRESRLSLVSSIRAVVTSRERNWGLVGLFDVSVLGLPSAPLGPSMPCLT